MFGLSLTRLGIGAALGAVLIASLFWAGNVWGPNARWKASRQAADAALNAVLTDQAEREDAEGLAEDNRFAKADADFEKLRPLLGACLLTSAQADALNAVGE